ncbi:MAG: glycosyl transferase family 1 [Pirellula sp.]|nr:glycosyl transferase family 1 [Pirellula sp.]
MNSRVPWVLVSTWINQTAGQGRAVAALAEHLARHGVPLHLVGSEIDPVFKSLPEVTIHHSPKVRGADVVGNLLLRRQGRRVAKDICERHPGARVVVNGGNCRWADINWVHYLHHAWQTTPAGAPGWYRVKERAVGALYRTLERSTIRSARIVITNSDRTTQDVVERLNVASERVRTVYYGTDPSWAPPNDEERMLARRNFGITGSRPAVVFVGGFGYDRRKGFDTLLKAWGILCRDPAWDADLLMAGSGKATSAFQREVGQVGLSERVRLLGFVEHVDRLLAAADLLVSPVRYEPFGLNVQEAVVRGVPAMVSAVAGVAERYPEALNDFVLTDADSITELVDKLRKWRRSTFEARSRFEPFGVELRRRRWEDMAEEFVAAVSER